MYIIINGIIIHLVINVHLNGIYCNSDCVRNYVSVKICHLKAEDDQSLSINCDLMQYLTVIIIKRNTTADIFAQLL